MNTAIKGSFSEVYFGGSVPEREDAPFTNQGADNFSSKEVTASVLSSRISDIDDPSMWLTEEEFWAEIDKVEKRVKRNVGIL